MKLTIPLVRLAIVAFAASFASPFLTVDAMAAKAQFERNKPHVNVGTIGHVDQGKNAEIDTSGATSLQSSSSGGQGCQPDATKAEDQPAC